MELAEATTASKENKLPLFTVGKKEEDQTFYLENPPTIFLLSNVVFDGRFQGAWETELEI